MKTFLRVLLHWTLVGTIGHVLFLMVYHNTIGEISWGDCCKVLLHALKLDIAIAAYLTIIPAVMLIIGTKWKGMRIMWNGYYVIFSAIYALANIANIGLYGQWEFPLDYTPILYLRTSLTDAMASITITQMTLSALGIALLTYGTFITRPLYAYIGKYNRIATALFTVALILPIRGGTDTGTNHTGAVYFSDNMKLNHAAVNPVFCFMESTAHQTNFAEQYRFMTDEEANKEITLLNAETDSTETDLRDSLFTTQPKRIILVVLEGFSTLLMEKSGRVKGVTPCLEQLCDDGVYFTNFYASSWRTDRALLSILSGLPASPTMSLIDQPKKSNTLPSIARTLTRNGWNTTFYYGGDTGFSNMQSYLMATGFQHIVSDKDFPRDMRTGKWGVPDGPIFESVEHSLRHTDKREFIAIMTLSSHEPFDVPHKSQFKDARLNAFHYTDSCLGRFIRTLQSRQDWGETLVAIVPDHKGAYPDDIGISDTLRYLQPLLMTGGIVKRSVCIPRLGGQTDIAATLLSLLRLDYTDFPFSHSLLMARQPRYAFLSFPDGMGLKDANGYVWHDNVTARILQSEGNNTERQVHRARAYLQKVYDYMNKL